MAGPMQEKRGVSWKREREMADVLSGGAIKERGDMSAASDKRTDGRGRRMDELTIE